MRIARVEPGATPPPASARGRAAWPSRVAAGLCSGQPEIARGRYHLTMSRLEVGSTARLFTRTSSRPQVWGVVRTLFTFSHPRAALSGPLAAAPPSGERPVTRTLYSASVLITILSVQTIAVHAGGEPARVARIRAQLT